MVEVEVKVEVWNEVVVALVVVLLDEGVVTKVVSITTR